jgi:hypothetical protein
MRTLPLWLFLAGLLPGALLVTSPVRAEKAVSVGAGELPAGLDYEGNLVAARLWEDGQGTNYLLLTRTPDIREPGLSEWGEAMYSARLYGYHYRQQDGGFELLRRITDFVMECDADLTVAHIPASIAITDLDGDGLSEVTFLYEMNCTSDVSPLTLKLMMLEDGEKYAIRGTSIVGIGGGRQIGGEKGLGEEFASAPVALQDFASTHWDRFVDPGRR